MPRSAPDKNIMLGLLMQANTKPLTLEFFDNSEFPIQNLLEYKISLCVLVVYFSGYMEVVNVHPDYANQLYIKLGTRLSQINYWAFLPPDFETRSDRSNYHQLIADAKQRGKKQEGNGTSSEG